MSKDFMLTVWSTAIGARDIQVNNAPDMHTAIMLAEKETGCRVDHGRSGIQPEFDPGIIIDAKTKRVNYIHENEAVTSMQIHNPVRISVTKGEGSL